MWISRLFIELANKNYKVCLTLDCSNINIDGPGKFRTKADDPETQFCYFNNTRDEQVYNRFISKRIKGEKNFKNNHLFEIVEVVSRFDENIRFNASNKLKELENGSKTDRDSETFRAEKRKGIFDERFRTAFDKSTPDSREESISRNNEILRKRAKPGYLLRR